MIDLSVSRTIRTVSSRGSFVVLPARLWHDPPSKRRNLLRRWHAFSIATLGRRTRFHDLRHTAATLMLGEGVPLKVISEMLGQSGIQITSDIYTEVVDALKSDAAARLDGLFA